jgi:PqqD family protein of HPr-rel-A system
VRYRADDGVRSVPLDDLTAIYHRTSGQTHIVGEPVPQMLALLGGDGLTIAELLSALAHDHGLEVNADSEAALQARLDELCASGLVSRA